MGRGAASSLLRPRGCPNPNLKLGTSWGGARSMAPRSRPPLFGLPNTFPFVGRRNLELRSAPLLLPTPLPTLNVLADFNFVFFFF